MLAVILVMAVLFSGCDLLQKAQNKVVETGLNVAINVAMDKAIGGNEEVAEVAGQIKEKVTLTVVDSTISGEGVIATCVITAPDMTDFIKNFDAKNYSSNQEMYDAILAAVNGAEMTEKEVTVGLKKTETGYEPTDIGEFVAAYFGTDDMDLVNDLLAQLG